MTSLAVDTPLRITGTVSHRDVDERLSGFLQYYESDQIFELASNLEPSSTFECNFTVSDHQGWHKVSIVRVYAHDLVGLRSLVRQWNGVIFVGRTAPATQSRTPSITPPRVTKTPFPSVLPSALVLPTRRATQSPRQSRSLMWTVT
jgi:hypothetical protein